MKAAELHAAIAQKAELGPRDVAKCMDAFTTVLIETLANGGELKVNNLGVFKTATRAATQGRNPRTGAAISLPASRRATFKGGKAVIDALNEKAVAAE